MPIVGWSRIGQNLHLVIDLSQNTINLLTTTPLDPYSEPISEDLPSQPLLQPNLVISNYNSIQSLYHPGPPHTAKSEGFLLIQTRNVNRGTVGGCDTGSV